MREGLLAGERNDGMGWDKGDAWYTLVDHRGGGYLYYILLGGG